jgi:predicted nucleotide-binding protein
MDRRNDVRFQEGMERQRGILSSALEHVGKFGLPDVTTSRPTGARVFISHGTAEDALDAIAHFVEDDLGLKAVVVKRSASEGAAVDDAVEGLLESCDAAVVLATADDHVGDGKMQPRPNVLHEIGLAQAKFPGRIIYLKETGATFPSNVAPKIWEDFTRENYGPAFKKIARELRAFGLL